MARLEGRGGDPKRGWCANINCFFCGCYTSSWCERRSMEINQPVCSNCRDARLNFDDESNVHIRIDQHKGKSISLAIMSAWEYTL